MGQWYANSMQYYPNQWGSVFTSLGYQHRRLSSQYLVSQPFSEIPYGLVKGTLQPDYLISLGTQS